jgi:catalase
MSSPVSLSPTTLSFKDATSLTLILRLLALGQIGTLRIKLSFHQLTQRQARTANQPTWYATAVPLLHKTHLFTVCPVINFNRDGAMRHRITKGVNYWPNRFSTAAPQAEAFKNLHVE